METVDFVLTDVAFPKLKTVIITYFRAYRDGKIALSAKELVAYSEKLHRSGEVINNTVVSGSTTFLCKLGILEEQPKSRYGLTSLGINLGLNLRDNMTSLSRRYWSEAIENSNFLRECFYYVRERGNVDQSDLQKEIIAKLRYRKISPAALRGAHTIIDIWEEADYIIIQGASNKDKRVLFNVEKFQPTYISNERIASLRIIKTKFNLSKLIQVCEEININYEKGCYLAVGILVRLILDHVPPIFGKKTFVEVASNYGGTQSFRDSAENLEKSTRKISDMYLHDRINDRDQSANPQQVLFRSTLDILLGEIINILNSQNKQLV